MLTLPLAAASVGLVIACASSPKQDPSAAMGDWFGMLRGDVLEHVEDADQARRAQAIIDRMDLEVRRYIDESERQMQELEALNANYDATRANFEAVFAQMDSRREAVFTTIRNSFVELRKEIEPGEWSEFDFSRSIIDVYQTAERGAAQ